MLALDGTAAGNRNDSTRACSPSPTASSAAAPRTELAMGHGDHHLDHPPAGPLVRLTSKLRPGMSTPGTRGTSHTQHDSREARHNHTLKNGHAPVPQPTRSRTRKIEANLCRDDQNQVIANRLLTPCPPIGTATA
jgi:hypothetical protein